MSFPGPPVPICPSRLSPAPAPSSEAIPPGGLRSPVVLPFHAALCEDGRRQHGKEGSWVL